MTTIPTELSDEKCRVILYHGDCLELALEGDAVVSDPFWKGMELLAWKQGNINRRERREHKDFLTTNEHQLARIL